MVTVKISDRGCRGCTLCVDVCPVDVFGMDEAGELALVRSQEDCIGCYSCVYACPSGCVELGEVEMLRPFHRIPGHEALVEKFLKEPTPLSKLTDEDKEEAYKDMSVRLRALADAISETMGRGQKAVGRRAGAAAAEHLPETYENKDLQAVLERLRLLFGFDFDADGNKVDLVFSPCALCRVVRDGGEKEGEAMLCMLFHEYWAGLVSAFVGRRFHCELKSAGDECCLVLSAD